MVVLSCALVRVKCGAFRIDMEMSMTVCDLRKAVKERENGRISDTDELDLYLAKRTDGDESNTWLRGDDDATVQLENRIVSSHIKAILEDEKEGMKAMWTLQKWMDENKMSPPPATRSIALRRHVENDGTRSTLNVRRKTEAGDQETDSAEILIDEEVTGEYVHVHGFFDFVLQQGSKTIAVVVAKREDYDQGMVLADVEGLEVTGGIVTDYINWIFIVGDDEKVQKHQCTLSASNSSATRGSLRSILRKVCGMFDDHCFEAV